MPFNIELTKQSNAIIKIQSVKNTISIYIKGTSKAVELATLRNWQHLENHFINTMPEYHADWVRGPDAPHIKKNHTSSYEVTSTHYHSEFNTEITPGMFSFYLRNIFTQQLAHPSDEYQFLSTPLKLKALLRHMPSTIVSIKTQVQKKYMNRKRH
ncbi:hypothetical protein Loa_01342 [Legionella oakridgensis ATCC 33761 = DSM 21215]|uniref:Uncharacterized protein n=1 Tax=Legionella oakridgensis ATCC 33761 = DSM 21215 TaxID=1268635 RepID=W0BAM9_9GAMM|nr:hypothetical protein [Legionella oakridgensis]AHE66895.1 hypothetical protein Loa_01342 [Legionella oakridgensis ATCC 33761 = DSM 21215]